MKNIIKNIKGFTLVEMMVVVAIIAILSSVFLIGLGSFRGSAYDARRLSDLQSMQAHLEIFYNKNRGYPGGEGWEELTAALTGDNGVGISQIPHDPEGSNSYEYWPVDTYTGGATNDVSLAAGYIIGAHLSDTAAQVMGDSYSGEHDCSLDGLYCVKF